MFIFHSKGLFLFVTHARPQKIIHNSGKYLLSSHSLHILSSTNITINDRNYAVVTTTRSSHTPVVF